MAGELSLLKEQRLEQSHVLSVQVAHTMINESPASAALRSKYLPPHLPTKFLLLSDFHPLLLLRKQTASRRPTLPGGQSSSTHPIMSHSQQQTPRCHEFFIGSDTDSRVYMELVLGHSAAKAARDQGCSSLKAEALAHARRALDIARDYNRPDLEEKALLGKAEFLLMMGRQRDSLEVEIPVAAKAEKMEIEQGADGQVISVVGVSMEQVAICNRDSQSRDRHGREGRGSGDRGR